MSRIRSVHPGLFTDEDFMALTAAAPLAAVLVPGLWCEADDQGVFLWKPLTLKARLLPNANADILELLSILEQRRFYSRFVVDGTEYGAIRNFRRWQRPQKPTATHPLPDELRSYVGLKPSHPLPVSEPSGSPTGKSPQMYEVGGRMEEVGEKEVTKEEAAADAAPPSLASASDPPKPPGKQPRAKPKVPLPSSWVPRKVDWEAAGLDAVGGEFCAAKMRNWAESADARKVSWDATYRNFCLSEAQSGKVPRAADPFALPAILDRRQPAAVNDLNRLSRLADVAERNRLKSLEEKASG